MPRKEPKGLKGFKRKLRAQKQLTQKEIKQAMLEASNAIDRQAQEIAALKRIIIGERAQLIFYTDKAVAYARGKCLDPMVPNFLDQPEDLKESYIKRAMQELESDQSIVPHDPEAAQAAKDADQIGRGIVITDGDPKPN